jgi:hypothetical protein
MATFVRVVDTGSFSAAARQLRIGQPALSKTIAQLEERLQVRLLTRTSHALLPTDASLRFCERAQLAIQEAGEAEIERAMPVLASSVGSGFRQQRPLPGSRSFPDCRNSSQSSRRSILMCFSMIVSSSSLRKGSTSGSAWAR